MKKIGLIFLIVIIFSILIVGCKTSTHTEITGAVAADTQLQNLQETEIQETAEVQEQTETEIQTQESTIDKIELLKKKQDILAMMKSGSYDKVQVSLLLNDVSIDPANQPIIDAWNEL